MVVIIKIVRKKTLLNSVETLEKENEFNKTGEKVTLKAKIHIRLFKVTNPFLSVVLRLEKKSMKVLQKKMRPH